MAELAGFPYFEVQFNKQGAVHDQKEVDQVLQFVGETPVTDLIVISHGWNNDMKEARQLYKDFFARAREMIDEGSVHMPGDRKLAVLGVLWPSKKFADDELKPSGAASGKPKVPVSFVKKQLDGLKGVFDNPKADKIIEEAKKLVPELEDKASARRKFVKLVRSLPNKERAEREDGSDRFFKLNEDEVMVRLSKPVREAPRRSSGGGGAAGGAAGGAVGLRAPAGGAAGLGSMLTGFVSAARNLLNYTTYYQMKERAGLVGSTGLNAVMRKIRAKAPNMKIHLVGHSFGGRLVAAAALGPSGGAPVGITSMTLLQAAFSHNGFGEKYDKKNDGFFRKVVSEGRVSGPLVITCTENDKAVGLAYPLASLLSGDDAAALGDKNDRFGGIGRNGALVQFTPEATDATLDKVGASYAFKQGKLYNLNADKFISGHSDVCGREVAYATLTAIMAA